MLGHGAMVVPSCALEACCNILCSTYYWQLNRVSFVEVHLVVAHVVFGVVDVVSGTRLYMYASHCV